MGTEVITRTRQGLDQLAEWVDAHPDLGTHPHLFGAIWIIAADTAEEALSIVQAMADGAPNGSITKTLASRTMFVERQLAGEARIQMQVARYKVPDQATFDAVLAEANAQAVPA